MIVHKLRSVLNPLTVRAVLIVTGLMIAALIGGAPHDFGGG